MSLEIHQREKEGITILDLKGHLVLGPEDAELRRRLNVLVGDGAKNLILNLHDVTHMDSASFGSLVSYSEELRKSGGRIVVLNVNPKHTGLSEVFHLDTVFDVYTDEQDAINSFFPDRVVPHFDILEFVEEQERESPPAAPKKE